MKSKLATTLREADTCIAENGMKLRKKVKRYAEGGKVAALSALSKKFLSALEMDDTEQAKRVGRQLDSSSPGTSAELRRRAANKSTKPLEDKAATFAKGGKVKVEEDDEDDEE